MKKSEGKEETRLHARSTFYLLSGGIHLVDNIFGIVVAAEEGGKDGTVVGRVTARDASRFSPSWFNSVGNFDCTSMGEIPARTREWSKDATQTRCFVYCGYHVAMCVCEREGSSLCEFKRIEVE